MSLISSQSFNHSFIRSCMHAFYFISCHVISFHFHVHFILIFNFIFISFSFHFISFQFHLYFKFHFIFIFILIQFEFLRLNSFMSIHSFQVIHFMHFISFQFASFQLTKNSYRQTGSYSRFYFRNFRPGACRALPGIIVHDYHSYYYYYYYYYDYYYCYYNIYIYMYICISMNIHTEHCITSRIIACVELHPYHYICIRSITLNGVCPVCLTLTCKINVHPHLRTHTHKKKKSLLNAWIHRPMNSYVDPYVEALVPQILQDGRGTTMQT